MQTSLEVTAESLSRLANLGYEATLDQPAWRAFADEAARVFGCQLAIVEIHDQDSPGNSFLVAGGLDGFEEACRSALAYRDDDLYWLGIKDAPSGTARLGTELVSPAHMRHTRSYSALAMPWHLEHFLLTAVTTGGGVEAYFSLGRTLREAAFVPEDKVLINHLVPHLGRSITLHRELEATRRTNALLSSAMDQSPFGIVVFDAKGQPILINKEAAAVFSSGDALTLRNGALHTVDPGTQARLAQALSVAQESGHNPFALLPEPVLVSRTLQPHPYQVIFSPLNPRIDGVNLPSGTAVVACIYARRIGNVQQVPQALAVAYDFSRAEVRLCEAMLRGQSLPEAAGTLQITRNTAKTHLARIFDKTGVHSQAALLRLLTPGAYGQVTEP